MHAFAYFSLTTVWLFAFRNHKQLPKIKLFIIIALALYGALMEFLQQAITKFRTADLYDEIANITGIILAVLLFDKLLRAYNSI